MTRRSARAAAIAFALCMALARGAAGETRAVVDAAGRHVEIPVRIERVFAAGPPAAVAIFVVAPETLLGWTHPLSDEAKALLPESAAALPVLGQLTGRAATASLEAVVAARPDLIVDVGGTGATYASLADRTQRQSGIPYLLLDGSLEASAALLRSLGEWLGRRERGEALAAEADAVLGELRARLAGISPEQRPRVYQARGATGLETSLPGSIGAEVLDFLGARQVSAGATGRVAAISMEQLVQWDPEVILTLDRSFFARLASEPLWRATRAVKDGRVHLSPAVPFGWIDAPPSVNRLLGVRWAAARLYPETFREDLRPAVRAFYRRFYGVELDEARLDQLSEPAGVGH